MISVELKLTPYDEPKLGLNIKTTTSLTVITGEKEAFLRICARAWDQHHGETPAVPEGSTYDR